MVEIFKTNIADRAVAEQLVKQLEQYLPASVINFDLDDCDRILRVDSKHDIIEKVHELLHTQGYICEVLAD